MKHSRKQKRQRQNKNKNEKKQNTRRRKRYVNKISTTEILNNSMASQNNINNITNNFNNSFYLNMSVSSKNLNQSVIQLENPSEIQSIKKTYEDSLENALKTMAFLLELDEDCTSLGLYNGVLYASCNSFSDKIDSQKPNKQVKNFSFFHDHIFSGDFSSITKENYKLIIEMLIIGLTHYIKKKNRLFSEKEIVDSINNGRIYDYFLCYFKNEDPSECGELYSIHFFLF